MLKRIILISLISILLFSVNAYCIDGYVELHYNTQLNSGIGKLNIYQDFNRWRIGGNFLTQLKGFKLKGNMIPAGIPYSQYYGLYVNYKLTDNITIIVSEWCNHYFDHAGNNTYLLDKDDVTVGIKYNF